MRPSRPATTLVALGVATALVTTGCSSDAASSGPTRTTRFETTAPGPTPTTTPITTPATTPATTSVTARAATPTSSGTPSPTTSAPRGTPTRARTTTTSALPLALTTGDATQVITVVADGSSATRATVQRWTKSGSRWRKVGHGIDAYVGSAGVGKASEGSSKTPKGSFTLTQAFGRNDDPGTRLPYVRTTDDDYWISSPGADYNTRQRCGSCGYGNGVNEHLRAITPEYRYAVVIDYNTRNAPGGVRAGRGSAFFLHVAHGAPTAGCVSIPQDDLVTVMRWLRPADHPRILIGTD